MFFGSWAETLDVRQWVLFPLVPGGHPNIWMNEWMIFSRHSTKPAGQLWSMRPSNLKFTIRTNQIGIICLFKPSMCLLSICTTHGNRTQLCVHVGQCSVLFSLWDRELAWDLTLSQTTRPSTCVSYFLSQMIITHTQALLRATCIECQPHTHIQLLTSDRSNQENDVNSVRSLSVKPTTTLLG